ncbi:TetR/AcrR family transcriptional regulator [Rhodococcus triatomae]|uniref:DNA-binding transcriptional regulator, AcrR family n=1 Tax=Rhodococcus triatomae TaxID=300028 RepID=A0A1G8GPP0_9NOCA|nr:TetR/AcrR family transcriptional regulator [Rhodococcus triatomae]QNG20327.1 TetR/AcrR family transcriptional regulator [Rhodococcus triatomae]QNG23757.1 TetR/AcrR family transcriptional regulator [Rhodococcus triatomae]SDH96408.1 DNA-binding transcriptional regulator, AcrR family [Rhodococcus triatomae]
MHDTRARILAASSALFRRAGYTGTGLKQVAVESGAPFGSIYHFFPGGKQELGEEVIRTSGSAYQDLVLGILRSTDGLPESIEVAFRSAGRTLAASGFADACPIATVAMEVASTNEPLREAAAEVFDGWLTACAAYIREYGIDDAGARHLALTLVTGLEGAFVLARTLRSTEPLDAAGATAAGLARTLLEK